MNDAKAASTADAAFEKWYLAKFPGRRHGSVFKTNQREIWDAGWDTASEQCLDRAAEVIRTAQIQWSAEHHGDIRTQFVEEVLKLKEGGDDDGDGV